MSTTTMKPPRSPKAKPKSQAKAVNVNNTYALGVIEDLIEFESMGYCPTRAEVEIPKDARNAIKRLAVTLDSRGAKLKNGTLVKNSIPKAIAWLVEKFSESV